VRDHASGRSVARLDYEAHPQLAVQEMARILAALRAEHPGVRLAAVHRVGELAIGELAVIVGASAPHRAEAFAACRAAIERIKEAVPIWKKEWGSDGSGNWVNLDA
jgi:molybdopterin synthase catalytic subunit